MATRIMVVDDEPAIGKLLVYQLRGFGYQVHYVSDGMLALRHFVLDQPDLVLLDVMMPQISGWEVCRQIRACSSAPVIMLTAKGADSDVIAGLSAGADDYITKPFSMVQLQARIETVLRRSGGAHGLQAASRSLPRRDPQQADAAARSPGRAAAALRDRSAEPDSPPQPQPPQRLGLRLREARLRRGLALHQVERVCKVRWEFLQAIEQENFDYVPRLELRRSLKVYAEYLGLDLRDLLGQPKPAPTQSLILPHFAIIMAVMVVLIAVGLYLL
jgi:DNA-binding response OmpR family regulator